MTKSFSRNLLFSYLIFFLVCPPALAAGPSTGSTGSTSSPQTSSGRHRERVAVVEVFTRLPGNDGTLLRRKLEGSLRSSKKVELVSAEDVGNYFRENQFPAEANTEGDRIYLQAQNHFLNLERREAKVLLASALAELEKDPGRNGSLVKAHLLKAQMELGEGNTETAVKAMREAVALDASTEELDNYLYPPSLQRFYHKVREEFIKWHSLVDLTVKVRGEKVLPIYVNGVAKGVGPSLTLKVAEDRVQRVSAGGSAIKVEPSKVDSLGVSVTGKGFSLSPGFGKRLVGFWKSSTAQLTEDAVRLGSSVNAGKVVLMELEKAGVMDRMTLSVVDILSGQIAGMKKIDMVDVEENAESAVGVAAGFITGLSKRESARTEVAKSPTEGAEAPAPLPVIKKHKEKKSFFKTPIPWIIVGVVVAGAGAGLAFGMGGGHDPDPESTTSVSVSGPAP